MKLSKSGAVARIKAEYPRLSARLRDGEIRITERALNPVRAEAIAYYTDDAEDALNSAFCWQYESELLSEVSRVSDVICEYILNGGKI